MLYSHIKIILNYFQVMPMTLNPAIKTLILKYNDFHSVDASFNFYPELELVDLSSNQLVRPKKLSNNKILTNKYSQVAIPDRAFSSQRRLQELRLGGNKISELTDRTLAGLTRASNSSKTSLKPSTTKSLSLLKISASYI